MTIFNSYVTNYQRVFFEWNPQKFVGEPHILSGLRCCESNISHFFHWVEARVQVQPHCWIVGQTTISWVEHGWTTLGCQFCWKELAAFFAAGRIARDFWASFGWLKFAKHRTTMNFDHFPRDSSWVFHIKYISFDIFLGFSIGLHHIKLHFSCWLFIKFTHI